MSDIIKIEWLVFKDMKDRPLNIPEALYKKKKEIDDQLELLEYTLKDYIRKYVLRGYVEIQREKACRGI